MGWRADSEAGAYHRALHDLLGVRFNVVEIAPIHLGVEIMSLTPTKRSRIVCIEFRNK